MAQLRDFRVANWNGRTVLRYAAVIVNVGAGAFEAQLLRPAGASQMNVGQRIFDDAGAYRDVATPAIAVFGGDGSQSLARSRPGIL